MPGSDLDPAGFTAHEMTTLSPGSSQGIMESQEVLTDLRCLSLLFC